MRSSLGLALAALAIGACGANEAEPAPANRRPEPVAEAEPVETPATEQPEAEAEAAPEPEAAPPPEPEPVVIEAGQRLGPVRVGMTEAEVRALGLEESEVDPRSRRFGPYRIFFEDGAVRRVEARMGDLARIRFGEQTFAAGVHIHALRDAFGDCQWYEGGGERYRCADGTLFVHTTHSMDPARYTLAVERP